MASDIDDNLSSSTYYLSTSTPNIDLQAMTNNDMSPVLPDIAPQVTPLHNLSDDTDTETVVHSKCAKDILQGPTKSGQYIVLPPGFPPLPGNEKL